MAALFIQTDSDLHTNSFNRGTKFDLVTCFARRQDCSLITYSNGYIFSLKLHKYDSRHVDLKLTFDISKNDKT